MIEVRFFASVREQLGQDRLSLPAEGLSSVADVKRRLLDSLDEEGRAVLMEQRLLVAVNQVMSAEDAAVSDGDELAFFPPVTGG